MKDWKEVTLSCLDVASEYFKATSEESFGDFMDVVVDYLCNIKPIETIKTEVPKVVVEPPKTLKTLHKSRKDYTDKSLSGRFNGMLVYIGDAKGNVLPRSIARIVPGTTEKSKDLFKLEYSGDTLTLADYMKTFKIEGNISQIRFVTNPKVSLWMCKTTHYDILKNSNDILKYHRTKKSTAKEV